VASTGANTTSESSNEEKTEEKAEESKTVEASGKKGYGSDGPGEGVNLENVGVLALIGGTGASEANNGLMNKLIKDDLAKGIDQVMASGKLSAGRSQSENSSTDLNALLAYGELGEGKGGNSSIDEILKNDVTKNKPAVKLEKTGKVSVEQLGTVSGSEEAKGARDEESLLQMLRQSMGRLKYIYDKYLKTNPEIGGKLEVEVTINAEGVVANAVVLSSEIPVEDFKREIIAAIRRWKYEAIAQGQVKVVYPIIFIKTN
jgi:TonB family protein